MKSHMWALPVEVFCHFLRAEIYSLKTSLSVLALPFIYCTDLDKWLTLSEFLSLSMKCPWNESTIDHSPLTVSENYKNNSKKATSQDAEYASGTVGSAFQKCELMFVNIILKLWKFFIFKINLKFFWSNGNVTAVAELLSFRPPQPPPPRGYSHSRQSFKWKLRFGTSVVV